MPRNVLQSIAMLAIDGTVQKDGKVLIGGEICDSFPTEVEVEGSRFDLAEVEEVDPATGYTLAHYFKQDPKNESRKVSLLGMIGDHECG